MWKEYLVADLDLTEEGGIVGTRPYRDGGLSLDGTIRWVNFFTNETPWQGEIATYNTVADARARKSSSAYTPEPTPEELAEEAKAVKEYQMEVLKRTVNRKRQNLSNGLIFEDYAAADLYAEATKDTSQYITDIATTVGVPVNAVKNAINNESDAVNALVRATEAQYRKGARAIEQGDDVAIQEVRAALQAL